MRLDPLCDVAWRYISMWSIEPSSGADGRVFGQGDGTFSGRISGTAQWANCPRLRNDFALPDARGVLTLTNGGFVIFELTGLSALSDGAGVHVLRFQTEDPEHLWLNDVLAVGEGSIDVERAVLAMRYYSCVVDYRPGFPEADHEATSPVPGQERHLQPPRVRSQQGGPLQGGGSAAVGEGG